MKKNKHKRRKKKVLARETKNIIQFRRRIGKQSNGEPIFEILSVMDFTK